MGPFVVSRYSSRMTSHADGPDAAVTRQRMVLAEHRVGALEREVRALRVQNEILTLVVRYLTGPPELAPAPADPDPVVTSRTAPAPGL